jgi:hypothetical protein
MHAKQSNVCLYPRIFLGHQTHHSEVKTEDTVYSYFRQKNAVLQNYLTPHNISFSATDTNKVLYEIRNTLLTKAQSLNIKVDKDYEIVHERMT